MPHDPTVITMGRQSGYVTYTSDSGSTTNAAASSITFTYYQSNVTSACTGICGSNGFFGNFSGFYGITGGLYGQTIGSGGGGGRRIWEPGQAAALIKDFQELKTSWKRKRAEVKARRLFRRVVGDVAFRKFEKRGFHEIYGASRTRYRLRPGFRVQVMAEGDTVEVELCAHLEIGIPWFDSMAVQHLMLSASKETEDKFKASANQHPAHGPYPIQELTDAA
jgi:hypothetical protein